MHGIVAQRLLRTLCAGCREAYEAPREMLRALRIEPPAGDPAPSFNRARGCAICGETVYDGRPPGASEMLTMSETIRALVLDRADALDIERAAGAEGMQSMRLNGLGKLRAGITTVDCLDAGVEPLAAGGRYVTGSEGQVFGITATAEPDNGARVGWQAVAWRTGDPERPYAIRRWRRLPAEEMLDE